MLEKVQTSAGQLKTIIPSLFTTFAFVLTLFLGWVIYSQVVLIRLSLQGLRAIRELNGSRSPARKETGSRKIGGETEEIKPGLYPEQGTFPCLQSSTRLEQLSCCFEGESK